MAADQITKWVEKEQFWEAAAAKEDVAVSVAPTPVSLDTSILPTNLSAWREQWSVNSDQIHAMYACFASAKEDTVIELLIEVTLSKDVG